MMQNLKRNWIVGSKLTWGIWRILTRTLENLKNLHFNRLLLTKAVSGNNTDFLTREYTSKKVRGKNVDITTSEIMFIKVRGSYVDLWTSAITQKKICGNNVDFSNIEITLKKVRGNDLDFSISKITSKKYVKTTSKFLEICQNLVFDVLTLYPRPIDVDSTWCARWEVRGLQFSFNTCG